MGFDPVSIMGEAALVQGGMSVLGGMQQKKQAKKEAAAAMADAQAKAGEEVNSAKRYSQTQEIGYMNNGVDLSGSPLMVMQDTLRQGQRNANNTLATGSSAASSLRQRGSAALTQGIMGGFGDVLSGYSDISKYQDRYGKPTKPTGPGVVSGGNSQSSNYDYGYGYGMA